MFDLGSGATLRLRQRPLICMECSVISPLYLGLDSRSEALGLMRQLQDNCHTIGGNFTLLWHNSQLLSLGERNLFERMLGPRDVREKVFERSDSTSGIDRP